MRRLQRMHEMTLRFSASAFERNRPDPDAGTSLKISSGSDKYPVYEALELADALECPVLLCSAMKHGPEVQKCKRNWNGLFL